MGSRLLLLLLTIAPALALTLAPTAAGRAPAQRRPPPRSAAAAPRLSLEPTTTLLLAEDNIFVQTFVLGATLAAFPALLVAANAAVDSLTNGGTKTPFFDEARAAVSACVRARGANVPLSDIAARAPRAP